MHIFRSFLLQLESIDPPLIMTINRGLSIIEAMDDVDLLNELIADGFSGDEFVDSTPIPTIDPIDEGGIVTALHGSLSKFNQFSDSHIGRNTPNTRDGFFFTNDFRYIDTLIGTYKKSTTGTPVVYTCRLDLGRTLTLKNYFQLLDPVVSSEIYDICNGDPIDIFDSYREDIVQKAKENKCDSIHFRANHFDLYVVFDSSRIDILDMREFTPTKRYLN